MLLPSPEIKAGRTPNPDVLCNSTFKFGAFYDHLDAAHPGAFDRVASGHYARVLRPAGGVGSIGSEPSTSGRCEGSAPVRLALTPDAVKDQTYFLAALGQGQLARTLFPLGGLTKPQARRAAVGRRTCIPLPRYHMLFYAGSMRRHSSRRRRRALPAARAADTGPRPRRRRGPGHCGAARLAGHLLSGKGKVS